MTARSNSLFFFPAIALLAFAIMLLIASDLQARKHYRGKAGKFDYYTMVLSWSPTYCASRQGRRDRLQCGPQRNFAFVVHGLWPQYERGWPARCRTKNYWLSKNLINTMLDIMPSKRLVIHQWNKHGTCAGVSQQDYFAVTRQLYNRIKIPPRFTRPNKITLTSPQQIKSEFIAANSDWLKGDMISVQCGNRRDRGRLRELRFCFTKDLQPRACGFNEKRACRARVLVLPRVR